MKDAMFSHKAIREALDAGLYCAKQGGLDKLTFEDVATLLFICLKEELKERKAQALAKAVAEGAIG